MPELGLGCSTRELFYSRKAVAPGQERKNPFVKKINVGSVFWQSRVENIFSPMIPLHPMVYRENQTSVNSDSPCRFSTDLYLVLHVLREVLPGGSSGEVCGQFWRRRREVSPHPPLGGVVAGGGWWKTTCGGGVSPLHLHHPPAVSVHYSQQYGTDRLTLI